MYVDAINAEATSSLEKREIVRTVGIALRLFERQLQLVRVELRGTGSRHVCRLRAWSAQGQKLVVESCAASAHDAIQAATDSLKQALGCAETRRIDALRAERQREEPRGAAGVAVDRPSALASRNAHRGGRVLVAVHAIEPCAASLYWANVLSNGLGADLVKHVASRSFAPVQERIPHAQPLPASESVERQRKFDWMVVPAHDGCGPLAAALARSAGCPVLVSRPPTTRSSLLIATDGEPNDDQVLESAAQLALALQASMPAFRDLQESSAWQADASARTWADFPGRLRGLRPEPPPEMDVLPAHDSDRVEAILQQAHWAGAEVIIVGLGAEPGSPLDGVAAAVASRTAQSVLIVPQTAPSDIQRPKVARRLRSLRPLAVGMVLQARCAKHASQRRVVTVRRRWRAQGAWPALSAAPHRR
jgi:nucleotide-binding universal stress UspA family protein